VARVNPLALFLLIAALAFQLKMVLPYTFIWKKQVKQVSKDQLNPDQQISVSRMRPDGEMEEITMTLRERLDELEAEAKQAEQDTLAAQTAISCALQFGNN